MAELNLIERIERNSLIAYAQMLGMTPRQFAKAKLAAIRRAQATFNTNLSSAGVNRVSSLDIDDGAEPVTALIALSKAGPRSNAVALCHLVSQHLATYGLLYAINWERLERNAREAGVQTGEQDWLLEYLLQISFIYAWVPNIEAFVDLFKNSAPRIVISANLHNVFEVGIVPLVLNMLSADGQTVPLQRRDLTPELVNLSAKVIIAIADTYLHRNLNAIDPYLTPTSRQGWVLQHTEIVDTVGRLIATGALDFVYLHEIAHAVFAHEGADPKLNELEADNLAINCVLQDRRQIGNGDDLLACFGAAGAVIACQFFELTDALAGSPTSDSHPPMLFRRATLSLSILGALAKDCLPNYQGLNEIAHRLFRAAREKVGSPCDVAAGVAELNEFRAVVIPSDKDPYIFAIKRGTTNSKT